MSVIVYHFWSPTCVPCQNIKPSIEALREDFEDKDIKWVSVNTHNDPQGYAAQWRVSIVPTMVVTKGGQEIGRHSGTTMSIYYTLIRRALAA